MDLSFLNKNVNKVTITVSGASGTGKEIIKSLIKESLVDAGVSNILIDNNFISKIEREGCKIIIKESTE